MDALGLNILKLDHVKEASREKQRGDCSRPLWHIGLYTYIASQLIGSTIALNYLKTQWVAPLGSVALIFNFIFAKILVGTNITRKDVLGTFVVVASVIWIVVFGGMYNGEDPEESISLDSLKILFVYCLNTALKLYSSVVVVPVFYGTYTALGLVNTIIYLDEIGNYPPWAIILVFVGIAVLIYGVALLSSKSDPAHMPEEEEEMQDIPSADTTKEHWISAKEEKLQDNKSLTTSTSSSSSHDNNTTTAPAAAATYPIEREQQPKDEHIH
ncbi:hypothetical protein RMATCC62417_09512 [Rhizopus microsporus]|nr:hypothetical protein RMATCC62417_09512 [Rhizopus microsporus]